MAIWLAFEDGNQVEHHMRWVGHEKMEFARMELNYIFNAISTGGGKHPNTYIYEGDQPQYGYPEEEFDLGEFEKVFQDLEKASTPGKQEG